MGSAASSSVSGIGVGGRGDSDDDEIDEVDPCRASSSTDAGLQLERRPRSAGTLASLSADTGALFQSGVRLIDSEVEGVEFVEKAVVASPLPMKAWIEFGRWNPLSLVFLVPAWSYHLSGPADHWWFISRSADHMYYYAAQFVSDDGRNHVTGYAFLGMWAAVASGLQYQGAHWWYARDWAPCRRPRTKRELDGLVLLNPAVSSPYSWVDNNCQHFALHLFEGTPPHGA